jgi:hypothetical protein
MTVLGYCDVPGCEDPKDPGFARPAFRNGKCSSHMKQLQRTGQTTAIAEKLNPEERAIQAGTAMLDAEQALKTGKAMLQADSDADYNRHRRAFLAAARALGDRERVDALRKAMKAAVAAGKRIGRPPKVDTERVLQLVRLLGKASLVAQVLGVTRMTIYRHLNSRNKRQGFVTAKPGGPRLAG